MGRGGFSSGGKGRGGGSRPACRSKASRDAEGNILIQRAAASNGFRSTWERIWYGPDNSHEDLCKSLVNKFESCVALGGGDRNDRLCLDNKRAMEEHCDEFRSSWNDWWAKEKKRRCDLFLLDFERCFKSHSKESEKRQFYAGRLKWFCDIEV
ncbi:hypothetical protein DM860_009087 [Cuscuta australis]|uniref:Uncharacterized protein n=1 Tax=Cuscuta australis TaxID=267555 RepID=A0A328D879_9ASTE|nr:hypothetical protein DM860_009087 [Cuscuta australis]